LDGQPAAGVAAGQEGLPMTINELVIDERIINRFLCNCQEHYQDGKGPPVYRARAIFFENLRQNYSVSKDIVPNLDDLNTQLNLWEAQAEDLPEAA
jgi:hypothetical protein